MSNFVESLYERGVAVLGAGNMGAGIAQKIAQEGIPVYLADLDPDLAARGKYKIAAMLSEAVSKKIFAVDDVKSCLDRIKTTADLEDLKNVALVIEAVFENHKVKSSLFGQLNNICASDTIFATNTSSLSVYELSIESGRPDRFGGLHFFYHPAKNKLLEVITPKRASESAEQALWEFARQLKKVSIRTSDSAGFAVNRFFVPWLNEAVRILEEGLATIPEIEASAKDTFKIGMGPFELMNVTGLAIAYHAASSLAKTFGNFYEPATLLVKQAVGGNLWDLNGADFSPQHEFTCNSELQRQISERLLGCIFHIATSLVEEGVASMEDTDRGATVGLRWAEGPFQMMNSIGVNRAANMVAQFSTRYPQLSVPESLDSRSWTNLPWDLSYVELNIKDSVARIAINRPEAMNALNPLITRQLNERFLEAENNPQVKSIVFEGIGKAFVAGADIRFFVDALDEKNFPRIYEFTKAGQDLFKSIAESKKPTVAFVNGIAYGGGAELALSCQKIIVGPNAQFAFPETGIGIYPGLGGTQRLPRKIGKIAARYLIFTGQSINSEDALNLGLADASLNDFRLVGLDDMARARACVEKTPEPPEARGNLPEWTEAAELLFSDRHVEESLSGKTPELVPADLQAEIQRTFKSLSRKAPLALKMAHRLIDSSSCPSIDEGLALELSSLKEIFASEDAYEGLSTLGKRRPVYKGR